MCLGLSVDFHRLQTQRGEKNDPIKGMLRKGRILCLFPIIHFQRESLEMHRMETWRRHSFHSRGATAMKTELEESSGKGSGDLLRAHTGLLWVGDW